MSRFRLEFPLGCLAGLAVAVLAFGLPAMAQEASSDSPIFQPGPPGAPGRIISAAEALELGRSTWVEADVRFMQHMIVHHGQAVEMVDLLETRGASPVVKALGRRIAISQEAEIALMREWLSERGLPLEAADLHDGHGSNPNHEAHAGHGTHAGHAAPSDIPLMPGMLSPGQMTRLEAAAGAEFDRLFLEGMIRHHQGALDMVDELLAHGDTANDPALSDFTSSVVADQSAEILRMQNLLSRP